MTYKEQLLDPRWQKKRLSILERDSWTCKSCFDDKATLHIHHMDYINGIMVWEYDDLLLITVCCNCHEKLHSQNEHLKAGVFLKLYFTVWFNERRYATN